MEVNPVELKKEYSDYIYERNEFSLMESMMYFNTTDTSLATPILAQILRNQMLYVFNAKFDWFYNSETGVLFLDSVPISVREVAITAKCYYTFDTIPAYADDWLIDFSLCRAKQVEGRIRSKYQDTIPGAPTDGESLISEGKQDEDTLKEKLESFVPLDIGMRW